MSTEQKLLRRLLANCVNKANHTRVRPVPTSSAFLLTVFVVVDGDIVYWKAGG